MSCKKECKGRIVDAKRGIYCYCLEKKLPHLHAKSFPAYRVKDINLFISDPQNKLWKSVSEKDRSRLKEYLFSCGLEAYEVDLVMDKYVDGYTFKRVAELQGWVSARVAKYRLEQVISKLRKQKRKKL